MGEWAGGGGMGDWEPEDSESESACSWQSETDSVPHNWRGWTGNGNGLASSSAPTAPSQPSVPDSLSDAAAKTLARHFTLDGVEESLASLGRFTGLDPEAFQMKMTRFCFPRSDHDIRLYSVLASGNESEFLRGEQLFRAKCVKNLLQIGFHLSASVRCGSRGAGGEEYSVAITVDRCHITSCTCTCTSEASWCAHTVAVCLHRIQWPENVEYRAPLSESLAALARVPASTAAEAALLDDLLGDSDSARDHLPVCDLRQETTSLVSALAGQRAAVRRLQKFAQHLIQQLPRQVLPTAQGILDELKDVGSVKSLENGAPDPTSGGGREESAAWRMDQHRLNDKVSRMFGKLCTPAPTVFSDVNYLSNAQPPATAEWASLLKPLRGKDPEGLWNLLGIVEELLRRQDDNGADLLHLITQQMLSKTQVLVWWVGTKLAQSGRWVPMGGSGAVKGGNGLSSSTSQLSAASVADQVVSLWRLVALNPRLAPDTRLHLRRLLTDNHLQVVKSVSAILADENRDKTLNMGRLSGESVRWDLDSFPGFRSAVAATHWDWKAFPIRGLTYEEPEQSVLTATSTVSQLSLVTELEPVSGEARASASPSLPVLRPTCTKHIVCSSSRPQAVAPPPARSHAATNTLERRDLDHVQELYMAAAEEEAEEQRPEAEKEEDPVAFVQSKLEALEPISEERQIRFAYCQALHAHGHSEHAWRLAVEMAEEMAEDLLRQPSNLLELPAPIKVPISCKPGSVKKKRKGGEERMPHPEAVAISSRASETLERAAFLFDVLIKGPKSNSLAFQVALLALETPRQAAATKFLEVKMNQQEAELVAALRQLSLGPDEVEMVRKRARRLRAPRLPTPPVLPFALAQYVFSVLSNSNPSDTDNQLAFDAALATLALRCAVSEAEHPLLCEATRRQRGDLAIALLVHYKNDQEKLNLIMNTLLDPEMHQMFPSRKVSESRKAVSLLGMNRSYSGACDSAGLDEELMAQIEAETAVEVGDGGGEADGAGDDPSEQEQELDAASDSGSSGGAKALKSGIGIRLGNAPPVARVRATKRADAAPSLPGQASKAQAHFMTELAKKVLIIAGGTHSNAIFNAHQNLPPGAGPGPAQALPGGPDPALHLAAFKIGLYALGLDNKVSQNWLTRTYSTQVSWINHQAMEIGQTAIGILIQCWENHMTPTEVAGLADKASVGRDLAMLQATAELALSVLPHAHALSIADTKRALSQCKDQGKHMLEKACLAVEVASKDFSVHPEVLFDVARHWNSIYLDEQAVEPQQAPQPPAPQPAPQPHPQPHPQHLLQQPQHQQQLAAALQQQQQMAHLQAAQQAAFGAQFQQQPPFHPLNSQSHHIPPQLIPFNHWGKMNGGGNGKAGCGLAYNGQGLMGGGQPPLRMNPALLPYRLNPQAFLPPTSGFSVPPPGLHVSQSAPALQQQQHHSSRHLHRQPLYPPPHLIPAIQEVDGEGIGAGGNGGHKCLLNAYRLGMLAMETMGRRIQDERSYTKYGPNPTYGDDVKFLLAISKKLGLPYAQRFFLTAGQSIVSPYILWEMAQEAAALMASAPPNGQNHPHGPAAPTLARHGYASPTSLDPTAYLLQRSVHMFYEAAHQKLSHPRFMPSDVEEVLHLIKEAQRNFYSLPGGQAKFQDFLESVRKQKACKKELWNKITDAVKSHTHPL